MSKCTFQRWHLLVVRPCLLHCWTMLINLTWMRSCRTCGWYCRCCPCPASSGARGSWSPPGLAGGTSSRFSPFWGRRAGGSCGRTPWAPGQTSPCLSPSGSHTCGGERNNFQFRSSRMFSFNGADDELNGKMVERELDIVNEGHRGEGVGRPIGYLSSLTASTIHC